MKPHLTILSGWAFPPSIWMAFQKEADPFFSTTVLDSLAALHQPALLQAPEDASCWLLGGWSLGGLRVMQSVLENALRPDGLVLLSTTPSFCAREGFSEGTPGSRVKMLRRSIARQDFERLAAFYAQAALPHRLSEENQQQWMNATKELEPDDLTAGLDYLLTTDLRERARRIQAPSLVMHGTEDAVIPFAAGRMLSDILPCSSFVPVEASGHDIPFSNSRFLIESIAQFMKPLT